jgi:hypothetical protein
MFELNPQTILAVIGIMAVIFSIIKVFWPEIAFKVVSSYNTLMKNAEHYLFSSFKPF